MTTFPAIEPNTREYDIAGDFPMVEEISWPSFSTRYRTGRASATATSLSLSLTYLDRPQAEWLELRNHYNDQQGGSIPFLLPGIILQGQLFSLVRPNTKWRYAAPPEEQHKSGSLFDVTIQLESGDYLALLPVIIDAPSSITIATAIAPSASNDGIGLNLPAVDTEAAALAPSVNFNGSAAMTPVAQTVATPLAPTVTVD